MNQQIVLDVPKLDTQLLNYVKLGQVLSELGYIQPNSPPDS